MDSCWEERELLGENLRIICFQRFDMKYFLTILFFFFFFFFYIDNYIFVDVSNLEYRCKNVTTQRCRFINEIKSQFA